LPEARRRIHWTNVSIDTKVLVGRRDQERALLYMSQRALLDLLLAECHGEKEGRDSFAGSKRSSY
jgi:hypothetical protein